MSFAALLALLIGNAFVAYFTTTQSRDNAGWVTATHDVMDTLTSIRTKVAEAQSGQRGYIITGLPSYLDPYEKAKASIQGDLQRLAALTRDKPIQKARLESMRPLISDKFTYLDKTIQVRNADGFDQAQALVAAGEGERAMDSIRAALMQMYSSELELRIARLAMSERSHWIALLSLIE